MIPDFSPNNLLLGFLIQTCRLSATGGVRLFSWVRQISLSSLLVSGSLAGSQTYVSYLSSPIICLASISFRINLLWFVSTICLRSHVVQLFFWVPSFVFHVMSPPFCLPHESSTACFWWAAVFGSFTWPHHFVFHHLHGKYWKLNLWKCHTNRIGEIHFDLFCCPTFSTWIYRSILITRFATAITMN